MVTPRGASLLPLPCWKATATRCLRVIIELRSLVVSYHDDWVNFSSISFSRTPYWWRTCQLPKKPLSAFSRCCPNIIAAGLSEQDDFFFSKKFLCQKKDKRKFIQSSSWEKKCVSKRRRAPKKIPLSEKNQFFVFSEFFLQRKTTRSNFKSYYQMKTIKETLCAFVCVIPLEIGRRSWKQSSIFLIDFGSDLFWLFFFCPVTWSHQCQTDRNVIVTVKWPKSLK